MTNEEKLNRIKSIAQKYERVEMVTREIAKLVARSMFCMGVEYGYGIAGNGQDIRSIIEEDKGCPVFVEDDLLELVLNRIEAKYGKE